VKYNLEKLARYQEQLGRDLIERSDEINQTVNVISSDTDLRIFIDSNKSHN
jgi:hypothetical protein